MAPMAVYGGGGRRARAGGCWSELPTDLLVLIVKRLTIVDHIRLGAVCTKWNSVAKSKLCRPAHLGVPWLMFPPGDDDDGRRSFLDVSTNETHAIRLSELQGRTCIGTSADGSWVVFVRKDMELGMLNVFGGGRQRQQLPPLPLTATLWDLKGAVVDKNGRAATYRVMNAYDTPTSYLTFTPQEMLRHFYRKAIVFQISSSTEEGSGTLAIALIHGVSKTVSVARVGDADWKVLKGVDTQDILFHRGRLYVVDGHGRTVAFDLRRPSSFFGSCSAVPQRLGSPRGGWFDQRYLVPSPSSDDVVQLCRCSHYGFDKPTVYRSWNVKAFRPGLVEGEWVEHTDRDLGGYILFLGRNHAVALRPGQGQGFPHLTSNSIYFTHDDCAYPDDLYDDDDHGLGVFSFEQGSWEALPWPSAAGNFGSPIWVAPPSLV